MVWALLESVFRTATYILHLYIALIYNIYRHNDDYCPLYLWLLSSAFQAFMEAIGDSPLKKLEKVTVTVTFMGLARTDTNKAVFTLNKLLEDMLVTDSWTKSPHKSSISRLSSGQVSWMLQYVHLYVVVLTCYYNWSTVLSPGLNDYHFLLMYAVYYTFFNRFAGLSYFAYFRQDLSLGSSHRL